MKLKSKKLISLILSGAMFALAFTGCGSQKADSTQEKTQGTENKAGTDSSEKDTTAEKVKLTYWAPLNANQIQVINSYADSLFWQELQEQTGVEIEFLHPPVGQDGEQFKLMIASRNDLPDIIDYSWTGSYPGGPEKAIKDGIIISLNDYMEQMPNYKASFEQNPTSVKEGTTDGGSIYGFHALPSKDAVVNTMSGLMIRQDWLEELGLEYPKTIEDWEKTLIAFRDEKGAESPYCIDYNNFMIYNSFNAAYGVGNGFYVDDTGKVQYGMAQPEYKEYLTTMNRWYKEGLIEQDFASVDKKYVDSQILNNQAGASYGWIGGDIGTWTNGSTTEGFKITGVANPTLAADDIPFLAGSFRSSLGPQSACITTVAAKDEKKMEAIIRVFEYLYSEEGLLLKNFGVEGETYTMVNNEPIYTDLITNNPDGLSMAQTLGKYTLASVNGPGHCQVIGYLNQYYQLDSQKESLKAFNEHASEAEKHTYPMVTANPEEAKELSTIMTDIGTVRDEAIIAFITGVRPLEEYDDFIKELKALGIDRAVEIKQAGLDRYNAK